MILPAASGRWTSWGQFSYVSVRDLYVSVRDLSPTGCYTLAVPVHLLISATVVVAVATAACGGPTPPPMKHVADVKQLMKSVVDPAADAYWDGVGTIIDQTGTTEIKPETAEDWDALVNHAYVLAESGNLLMLGPRVRDGGDWLRLSRAMVDVGEKAIRAAESRNPQAVFDVGAEVYEVCTACHAKYAVDLARPNTQN